jgi:hypothetical protein
VNHQRYQQSDLSNQVTTYDKAEEKVRASADCIKDGSEHPVTRTSDSPKESGNSRIPTNEGHTFEDPVRKEPVSKHKNSHEPGIEQAEHYDIRLNKQADGCLDRDFELHIHVSALANWVPCSGVQTRIDLREG